ncbi:26S protease regulatory subunit 8 [Phyllosticta capitalensis]|uniref:26S protease regulatory subunit 8 n=1 Tax=Phyllosticta capitalensis TaxID=121624 RepID=A0ABR1YTM8_9PEZI
MNVPAVQSKAPQDQQQQLATELAAGAPDGAGGSLFAQLTGNPYFTAGFGLAGLATVGRIGQKGLTRAAFYIRRRMLVELEVTRRDKSYPWLLRWMSNHHRAEMQKIQGGVENAGQTQSKGAFESLVRRFAPRIHEFQIETGEVTRPDGRQHTQFSVVPGLGRHIIRYDKAWILVNRERQGQHLDYEGQFFETIRFTTLYSHRNVFERIFLEANKLKEEAEEGKTIIYHSRGMDWERFGEPKRKRPLDSVVLEDGVKERMVEDMAEFIEKREWYSDRGIPYRRGYLLYGPPGTGKSSFIEALAGHLDFNIAMLNVSQRGLTDDKLAYLLTRVPARTIVLLEDADAAWVNRKSAGEDGYAGATVTFSGLLNALDGVGSAEERIIFLTTNHVERLDEALIRPGRVDLTVRIGNATEYQIGKLWDRFYGDMDPKGAGREKFMAKVSDLGLVDAISPAELQGLFLYNKDDAEGAIASLDELAEMHAHVARKMTRAADEEGGP